MSKVKFQFISGPSPKYKALGHVSYEAIEVDEEELDRIKANGYNVEVFSGSKPKPKAVKKQSGVTTKPVKKKKEKK